MKRILLILIIILAVILFVGRGYYAVNAKGFVNFSKCRKLKGPISRSRLIESMGKPILVEDEGNNMKLTFETPSIMSGKITALIDKKTDVSFCIKCCEESGCR